MIYQFANYELDANKFELRCDGVVLSIAPQAFDFLHILVQNSGRLVTREEIIEQIWHGREVTDTTVSSCVKSARKILGDDGEHQRFIRTSRGRGFEFIHEVICEETKAENISTTSKEDWLSKNIKLVLISAIFLLAGILFLNKTFDPMVQNSDDERIALSPEQEYSIVVMPFMDMSTEGDQEYLASGITEEILNVLANIEVLSVTSRTTSFSLRGQNLSIPEVSERLGVKYVVEGSVRKSGNRVRVTAQLIDAKNDNHLWSQNYDRELVDIFAIQDEIGVSIANVLKIEVQSEDFSRDAPTTNMEAYEYYLQGHQLFLERGINGDTSSILSLEKGIVFLEEAVTIDPDFALAWADIASSYLLLVTFNGTNYSLNRVSESVNEAADRAISLDPDLSEAWAVKGFLSNAEFRFEEAERELLLATELDPKNETAWLWLSIFYSTVGNHDRALDAVDRAIDIAPDVTMNYGVRAIILHAKGEVPKSEEAYSEAINVHNFALAGADLILLSIWDNDKERAIREVELLSERYQRGEAERVKDEITLYVNAYFDPSLHDQAQNLLDQKVSEISRISSFIGIFILQDGENLVRFLEGSDVNKTFYLRRMYIPLARPIFEQKVFRDYIIDIGLVEYWKNSKFPVGCRAVSDVDFICE